MLSAHKRWIMLAFAVGAISLHFWNAFADQAPANTNAADAPATTKVDAKEETPVQTTVPFAADEALYEGDDVITIADAPLYGDGDDDKELLTLSQGLALVARQIHGNWVLVDVNHQGSPVAGWVDRKYLSLISADSPGVLHESVKDIPKRLAELHASSEDHLSRSDFLQSLETCSAVLKIDPTSALAFFRRGHCRQMLGEDDKAIEDFDQAIQLEPKYEQAYLARGDARYSLEEYDQAMADYNAVLTTNPNSSGALYMRGRCWYAKGEFDQAIADYNAALKVQPNHSWAIAHRGDAYFAQMAFDAAIADFDKATQIDRTFDWAIMRRGDVWFYGKHDLDRAIVDYTFAHTLNPHNSWAIHQRGHCLEQKKDFAQAVMDYSEAVELDPEYWDFAVNLAWVLATCPDDTVRDGNKAIELATRACDLTDWRNSFSLGTLAAATAEAGQFDKAVEFEKKAIELASEGYDIELAKSILEKFRSNQPFREQ